MSSAVTGQMSAVATGQMSAAETGQMSAAETRQMYSIKTGQRPVAIVDICLVSTAQQQTSVLSQQQTSALSQQKTSGCFGVILKGTKMISTPFLHLKCANKSHEHDRHTAPEMPPQPAAQGLRQRAGGKDYVSS